MKKSTIIIAAVLMISVLCSCAGKAVDNISSSDTARQENVSAADILSYTDAKYQGIENNDPAAEYIGEWYDINSRRAHMYITDTGGGSYEVRVSWGSSAWSAGEWLMHARYDAERDCLVYEDGISRDIVYRADEDDPEITVNYTGSSGTVRHDRGRIVWTDSKDSELASYRVFLRIDGVLGIIWPDDLDILGYYESPGGEYMEIGYNSDGTFGILLVLPEDIKIFGTGVYDERSRVLTATADDGPDAWKTLRGSIELTIIFGEDRGADLAVTKSDSVNLPEGHKIKLG